MNLEKQSETLNDLVLINNDRMEGYRKGIDELKEEDFDLKGVFQERIDQSNHFHTELSKELLLANKEVKEGTMTSGKIYRAWMDVKAFFTGNNRKAILDNCVDGEEAAIKAYDSALECQNLTPEQRALIIRQQTEIKTSQDKIKALRDAF